MNVREGWSRRWRDLTATNDDRLGLMLLAGAITLLLIVTLNALRIGGPLGYDESVYSVKAWDLAAPGRVHATYWNAYRAPGFPAMLSVLFRLHRGVLTARLLVVLLGVFTLVCTWAIGRRLASPVVGGVAALLTAATPTFAMTSSFVLVDVPGVAFSLLAIVLFLPVLAGRISWWRVAAVVLTCWLAICVRFGAPFCFGVGLAFVGGHALLSAKKRRDTAWMVQTVATVAGAAAGVPIFYMSTLFAFNGFTPKQANDSLIESKGMGLGTGLRSFREWISREIVANTGVLVFTLCVLGFVVAGLVLAVRRPALRFPAAFFATCASLSALAVAAFVGQIFFNYLVVAIPFLALSAALGIVEVASFVPARAAVVVIASVVALVGGLTAADRTETIHRVRAKGLAELVRSSAAVAERLDGPCLVITRYSPQVTWLSGCDTSTFIPELTVSGAATRSWEWWSDVSPDAAPDRMAMLTSKGASRQPSEDDLDDSSGLYAETIYRTDPNVKRPPVTVILFDACAATASCSTP